MFSQASCCSGIARSPEGLKGHIAEWEGIDTYTTSPEGKARAAVIVVHDAFGFQLPNTKYQVDYLASKGFYAVLVDLFDREPWPESKMNEIFAGDASFLEWRAKKTSPEAFEKAKNRLMGFADHLRTQGFAKVGIIGFCYGGSASVTAATTGKVDVAVSIHGGGHTLEQLGSCKCPVLYLVAKGDQLFPKVDEVEAELKAHPEKGGIKIFEGVQHGWVNRGSYADEEIRKKADEAMADTAEFLERHLA